MPDGAERPTGDWTPRPDPTVLTTEQLERAVTNLRDYIDGQVAILRQRLEGMDTATTLLSTTVNKVPSEMEKEIAHLKSMLDERFTSVALQFKERDQRAERERADNKIAIDAAFAAQKEAAAEQNKANTKAIDKSEEATTDSIAKLGELVKSTTDALKENIEDLKERAQAVESNRAGIRDTRQQITGTMLTVGGFAVVLFSALISAVIVVLVK